jgi:hypothetical protein
VLTNDNVHAFSSLTFFTNLLPNYFAKTYRKMKEIGRNPIEKNGHKKIRAGGIENQGFFFIILK